MEKFMGTYQTKLNKMKSNCFYLFSYYEGGSPTLVLSDPDLLLEVFVKQFSNFHGRRVMDC